MCDNSPRLAAKTTRALDKLRTIVSKPPVMATVHLYQHALSGHPLPTDTLITVAPCRASCGARPGLAVYSGMAAFRRDVEPRHRKTRPTARRRHVGRAH